MKIQTFRFYPLLNSKRYMSGRAFRVEMDIINDCEDCCNSAECKKNNRCLGFAMTESKFAELSQNVYRELQELFEIKQVISEPQNMSKKTRQKEEVKDLCPLSYGGRCRVCDDELFDMDIRRYLGNEVNANGKGGDKE